MKKTVCIQCNDRGEYNIAEWNNYSYTVKRVCCNLCEAGKRMQLLQEKMKSPDYVNPFLNLTDEQIINYLNKAVKFDEPNRLL